MTQEADPPRRFAEIDVVKAGASDFPIGAADDACLDLLAVWRGARTALNAVSAFAKIRRGSP